MFSTCANSYRRHKSINLQFFFGCEVMLWNINVEQEFLTQLEWLKHSKSKKLSMSVGEREGANCA